MPSLSPELWAQVLTSVVTLIIGLSSGTAIVAWLNRRKTAAEAGLTDTQRQKLQDEIADGLRKDLLDADTNCDKRIKMLEAAREQDRKDCDDKLAESDAKIAELDRRLTAALAWGKTEADKSCEERKVMQAEIDKLRHDLADERELRQQRDDELKEIAESLP